MFAKKYQGQPVDLQGHMLFGEPDLREFCACVPDQSYYCIEVDIINRISMNEDGYFDFTKDMIDVGAGIGEYPCILPFNHNYIFEPDKRRLWMCHANLLNHNKWDNSTTYQMALSDGEGMVTIMENSTVTYKNVDAKTLDSYNLTNIGFIKIDVEGFEEQVIRGGIKTIIENNFPPILFECWPVGYTGGADMPRMTQENKDRLFSLLETFGYEVLECWGDWETHLAVHK